MNTKNSQMDVEHTIANEDVLSFDFECFGNENAPGMVPRENSLFGTFSSKLSSDHNNSLSFEGKNDCASSDPMYITKHLALMSDVFLDSLDSHGRFGLNEENSMSADFQRKKSVSFAYEAVHSAVPEKTTFEEKKEIFFFPPRQNSMTIDSEKGLARGHCWCSEDTCQQKYLRRSKHPRIIEPSSKLTKGVLNKKVQIRIPKELQSHISHGSCKHAYRALVTLITYVQLKCGFKVKTELSQSFRAPSQEKYVRARRVIRGFGIVDEFYVSIWAPTFQCRFVAACGGIGRVQNSLRDFFASREPPMENYIQAVEKHEAEKHEVEKHEVDDFKSECLCMQKILSDHTITNVRKMSLCTGILYKAIINPIKI
tara:strand:+ start:973 stop:2079 length:1107 start_codon:yes stop_codon:yes gene_type:complete